MMTPVYGKTSHDEFEDDIDLNTFVADDVGNNDGRDDDSGNDDNGDDSAGGDDISWATAATFWLPTDAQIARLRLESADIPVLILDENLVATQWQLANAVGGIKVQVPEAEVTAARSLLERPSENRERSEEPVSDGQDLCMRCGSPDIYKTWLSRRWSFISLFLFPPLFPFALGKQSRCSTCGYEWRKTPDEPI